MHLKYHEAAFGQIIDRVLMDIKSYIFKKIPNPVYYDKKITLNRLLQRFIELERESIQRASSSYTRGNQEKTIFDEDIIDLGHFRYYPKTGKLSIKLNYFLKSILKFILRWFKILFLYLVSFFNTRTKNSRGSTLIYDIDPSLLGQENRESDFIKFCKCGPIGVLNEASSIIVQSPNKVKSSDPKYAEYVNNPLYFLLSRKQSSLNDLAFFLKHFRSMFLYFKLLFSFPLMALLDEDIAYHALADVLNQQRLIENILITNSNASRQILWMSSLHNRYYKLHMAWYSQNGEFSYIYKWDPIQTSDIEYKYIVVDENWVWTKYFADNLSKIGTLGLFHSVGPILWYLPSIKKTLYENSIKVNIFDITPYSSNKLDRGGWKGAYNYGSYENLSNFIVDIIDIAKEYSEHKNKKVELLLKHKRSPGSLHDNNYIGLIDSFLESKELKIIHPYENMFNLISGSDLVIVLPYSSPAHVAHYLGVPAIFYDPSQDLIPFYDKSENVSFASGKKELMTTFFALLKEN